MLRSTTAALFVLFATALLGAACTPDRFIDSGCEVDDDCRGQRVCLQGRCIDRDRAPDAGGDTVEDTETLDIGTMDDVSEVDPEPFIGLWRVDASFEVLTEDGEPVSESRREELTVEITEGETSDLVVTVEGLETCVMRADIKPDNRAFEIGRQDCTENPIEEVEGSAEVAHGLGELSDDGSTLELFVEILVVPEQDFGALLIRIQGNGMQ